MASLEEAWHADVFREFVSKALRERAAVARDGEAERAAEDNAIWLELDGLRNEAEEHALDDVVPRGAVGDFFDELAVTGANSAGGSEVFPFVFLAVIEVFFVAWLEVAILVREFAAEGDAATDAGAKGVINILVVDAAGFGEGSEVGVVFDESRELVIFFELVGDIEGLPREIAEPDGAIVLHNAGHCDTEGDNFGHDEIDADLLEEELVEFLLIDRGLKLDGMKDFASCIHEGDDGFGAADVDTEIHNSIIQHIIPLMAIAKVRNA